MAHDDYLEHHGILGQRWGVRRYQNSDGTLTSAGKRRYRQAQKTVEKYGEKAIKDYDKFDKYISKGNRLLSQLHYSNKYVKDLERYKDAEDFIKSIGKTPMSVLEKRSEYKNQLTQSPYQDPYNTVWMLGPDGRPISGPTRYQMKNYPANGRRLQGYKIK